MKWRKMTALFLCSVFLFSGCSEKRAQAQRMLAERAEKNRHEITTFAMDTIMYFTIYHEDGEAILTDAEQEIRRLERLLSVTMEDSEIAKLNAAAGKEAIAVSKDTMEVLKCGKAIGEMTENAFDIAISPVVKAWGFTTDTEKKMPQKEVISQLLSLTNPENLVLDEAKGTAFLSKAGMAVDLGGVAKGYTSDAVTQLLREKGVTNGLFSLGGNVSAIGTKQDGSDWKIAVENPLDAEDYVGLLQARDCSVITSGGYQRFFEENGKQYHHIIDSKTGYPAESGLLSVTIISKDGAKADGLSTALFVLGLEDSLALWQSSDDFEVIFITEDGRVIATEGAAERFAFEGRDNDFVYETVKR